ncbi:Integrase core domain protein [compost metagenome]
MGHHVSAIAGSRKVLLPLLIEDIYSRKAVGWEVYEAESGEKAAALLQRSVTHEKCWQQPLVLHSDNGAPMKSVTLLTKMYDLGITPSRGRPRVSNDNPYSESLFRTLNTARSGRRKDLPAWMMRVSG